jgi:aspartate racemase
MFETVIESLINRGARAVVLGCTEIPLVVRETRIQGIPLINSIDSLAKSAVKKFKIE